MLPAPKRTRPSASHTVRWQRRDGPWQTTEQKPKSDREIKSTLGETETITPPPGPKSKPHLLCMWRVVWGALSTAEPRFKAREGPTSHSAEPLCSKALVLGTSSQESGKRKRPETLSMLLLSQQLWVAGDPPSGLPQRQLSEKPQSTDVKGLALCSQPNPNPQYHMFPRGLLEVLTHQKVFPL